ncbi:MAG: hypothetical protein AB7E13_06470 [Arcobacteraceae bacterium]
MTETRKLPRKTIIWISVLAALAVVYFLMNMVAKQGQVENALNAMNIKYDKLKVFTSASVKHNESGVNGYQFTVRYNKLDSGELCKGFVIILNNGQYVNDVECKKEDLW